MRWTAHGHNAWAVDTGQLLDNEGLVTEDTLLVVTSQSGASGEVSELLERRAAGLLSPGAVVGIANDDDSPLARAADLFLPLHSGAGGDGQHQELPEHPRGPSPDPRRVRGEDLWQVRATELGDAATAVQAVIEGVDLSGVAAATATHPNRRLAYVGARDSAGTAQFAALITKESAKIAAEGYVGGQFRHGPFELAGDGLTVVIFAPERGAGRPESAAAGRRSRQHGFAGRRRR